VLCGENAAAVYWVKSFRRFQSGVDVFFKWLHIGKFLLEASWPLANCTARVWGDLKYFAGSYVWLG